MGLAELIYNSTERTINRFEEFLGLPASPITPRLRLKTRNMSPLESYGLYQQTGVIFPEEIHKMAGNLVPVGKDEWDIDLLLLGHAMDVYIFNTYDAKRMFPSKYMPQETTTQRIKSRIADWYVSPF